ncbi:MAG: D-aminoacyl-tRNA deacylase [Candidatus Anstonellales archaeon]
MLYILYTIKEEASRNIAKALLDIGFKETERIRIEGQEVKSVLNIKAKGDECIVLSPHRSESNRPTLTVHTPGNWEGNEFGGEPRTLSIASPARMKRALEAMDREARARGLSVSVSYEVDHHGPTVEMPITFYEIGSTEAQWRERALAEIVAKAVVKSLDVEEEESFFGIGGGHYAPKFTALALEKGICFGHMLPKYSIDSLREDTFRQAVDKVVGKTAGVAVEKGVSGRQKAFIERMANEFGYEVSYI